MEVVVPVTCRFPAMITFPPAPTPLGSIVILLLLLLMVSVEIVILPTSTLPASTFPVKLPVVATTLVVYTFRTLALPAEFKFPTLALPLADK